MSSAWICESCGEPSSGGMCMACGRERPLEVNLGNSPGSAGRIYFGAGTAGYRASISLWSILTTLAIVASAVTFIISYVR